MTVSIAVCAIDWHSNSLILLLFAIPDIVAKLIAAAALLDKAVHDNAGLSKASEIFLWRCWPAFGELGTPRLVRKLERHDVLQVLDALKVNDREALRELLLLCNKMGVHLSLTKGRLKLLERQGIEDFGVGVDTLQNMLVGRYQMANVITNLLDIFKFLRGVGSHNVIPSLLNIHILDVKGTEHGSHAVGTAIGLAVTALAASTANLEWAIRGPVTWLLAFVADAVELTLDRGVCTLRFHVTFFSAIEACATATATITTTAEALWWFWAVTSEVPISMTAKIRQ